MGSQYNQLNFSSITLACLMTFGLAACGGGGSGTNPTISKTDDSSTLSAAAASNLTITTTSCPGGTQGTAYAGCTVSATGGTPPYTFGVSQAGKYAPLPEGITMDSATGAITSTKITGQGYYGTELVVMDSASNAAYRVVNFAINGDNKYLASIFPSNSIFHHRVDAATTGLPVDNSVAAPIASAYLKSPLQHFFGNEYSYPWPYGTPTVQVAATQGMVPVDTLLYNHYFTTGPIPWNAPVEGTKYSTGDRHVIVYVEAGAETGPALYEMYQGVYTGSNGTGSWSDGSNAMWTDVSTSNTLPTPGTGTTNAAGLADGPLLINADEVIGTGTPTAPTGTIKHTIRVTLPSMLDNWVWPATATSGVGSCAGAAKYSRILQSTPPASCTTNSPAGEIYRLKAGTAMPACVAKSPQSAIIIAALKDYGMILGDNGTAGQLIGTPDARWNDADLDCLSSLTLAEFEPVNVSSLIVSSESGETSH
jgi:hypothetical protein